MASIFRAGTQDATCCTLRFCLKRLADGTRMPTLFTVHIRLNDIKIMENPFPNAYHIIRTYKFQILCLVSISFLVLPGSFQWALGALLGAIGSVITFMLMSDTENIPNFIKTFNRDKQVSERKWTEFCEFKKICSVCNVFECVEHRQEKNFIARQPWADVKVPKKVDLALEELLNLVLKEHVNTWYSEIGEDEKFINEIRLKFRYVAAMALRRVSKIDIPQFIQTKILRVLIRHLHFYLEVKRKASPSTDLEQAVLDHYGPHIHVAVRNRGAELEYLGHMVNQLMPFLVLSDELHCESLCVLMREIISVVVILPAMDVLADPDIVNNILVLLFEESPPITCDDPHSPLVPLLGNFSKPKTASKSKLLYSVKEIRHDQTLMYEFMRFMRAEGAVSVLQFCLTIEEFNLKLLNPELSGTEMVALHKELAQLRDMYFSCSSLDTLYFELEDVQLIETICEGSPEGIIKLQTSTPLFRAYDQAYELLEKTFLPLFHESDYYFQYMCGRRLSEMNRCGSRANKKLNGSITSKIGSRIKGVFKPTSIEGKVDLSGTEYSQAAEERMELEVTDDLPVPSYRSVSYKLWEDGPLRDLSAWRVTIPGLSGLPDPENPKRVLYSFHIEVRRVDVLEDDFEPSRWDVRRQYAEFYVLEQKLKEFHGDFEGIELPAKKVFGTKSEEFLESKRAAFQTYLQRLLTLPNLKGSELLYHFLTSDLEMSSSFLPDINIGKLVKTGARILVKERGQHLEPFLESFLKSTESPKPLPCRWSDANSDTQSIPSEKMAHSVYNNNANKALLIPGHTPLHLNLNSIDFVPVDGAMDMIMYLMDNVYECSVWFHSLLMAIRFVFRGTLDSLFDWFLDLKIKKVSQDFRVEKIIHEVRDVLFFDTDPPRTDEQKQARKDYAFRCLKNIFPMPLVLAMGSETHEEGTKLMFEVLQKPRLNKQLSYMLLDEVLREAFPELLSELQRKDENL